MSRAEPGRVAELVAAGADVDDLQRGGSGTRDELRAAGRRRRDLLDELTEVAAARAGRAEAVRASIAATLDAASLDTSLQDDLLNGRLTAELAPAVRFLGDVGEAPKSPRPRRTPARPTKATREKPTPVRDDLAVRRAAAALAEARDRAEAADVEMSEAEAATREAEEALEAAHRQVAELDAALADARAEVTAAKRAVTEATAVRPGCAPPTGTPRPHSGSPSATPPTPTRSRSGADSAPVAPRKEKKRKYNSESPPPPPPSPPPPHHGASRGTRCQGPTARSTQRHPTTRSPGPRGRGSSRWVSADERR